MGGGILNAQALADHPGTADIINSTIANNIASAQGGGIFAGVLSDVNFNLQSTIIAQNKRFLRSGLVLFRPAGPRHFIW